MNGHIFFLICYKHVPKLKLKFKKKKKKKNLASPIKVMLNVNPSLKKIHSL